MPVDRPKLPELIEQGSAEFESRLPGVLPRIRNSIIGVLNRVIQGGISALYKYVEWLSDQWWPDRCSAEFLPFHGSLWGKPRIGAAAATGTVGFAGVNGSVIASGTVVQRSDTQQYVTTEAGVIALGIANIPVEAVEPGQLGNAVIGTELTLTTPIPGVNAVATAFTALSGGADIEIIERWRARILARIRRPPQGGADYDYEGWALEVPGVTRAWAYPKEQGPGTVVVRFVRDDDASIIPDAGEVAAVQAYIGERCSVIADLYVVAPIATPQDFTIQAVPDTPSVRAAIEAEIRELYRREAKPGVTMLITHQREAISISSGETDHVLSIPNSNQTHATGLLPTVGNFTWL